MADLYSQADAPATEPAATSPEKATLVGTLVHLWPYIWPHDRADLRMRDFSAGFLDHYLESSGAAVLSSVGAYQLEGRGAQLFVSIDGDYFTILGLPLLPLLDILREHGVLPS